MHIPDNFLNNQTSLALFGIAGAVGFFAVKKSFNTLFEKVKVAVPVLQTNAGFSVSKPKFLTKLNLKPAAKKKIEDLATVAAFIFACQMINFPVQSGTSGHFLGGMLAAIVLGPWLGSLALMSVLVVQAFIFSDGGVTALGANIFNMAIIGTILSYGVYLVFKKYLKNQWLAIALASWFSVVLASACCAVELAVSGAIPLNLVLPAMVKVHALIGITEALITIFALKIFFYEPQK